MLNFSEIKRVANMIYPNEIKHIFRAYDIRGVFNKTLFPDIIAKAAAIFANIIEEKENAKSVAISGDARTSSRILTFAAASGVASAGLDAYIIDSIPLPVFGFTIWRNAKIKGGAYVTASHNPPEWNGIRFRWSDGTGFSDENAEVKRRFFKNNVKWVDWSNVGGIYFLDRNEIINSYIQYILNLEPQPERRLKIVMDILNSVGGFVIPILFRYSHEVITLNSQVDGFFPAGTADPVHGDISKLQESVRSYKGELGLAFDGDADRSVIVDDKGRRVPPEIIAIILARELLKSGDVVVYNAECSSILRNKLEEIGIKTVESRVGDVFVAKQAKQARAKIAVESSYHFFIPLYGFYYDDAILVSYILASILSRYKKPLSEIVDEIGHFYVVRENIPVDDELKWKTVDYLKDKFSREYENISTIDGVKVYLEDGSVLIRPSNTEPVVRMTTEAMEEDKVSQIHKKFKQEILAAIERVRSSTR